MHLYFASRDGQARRIAARISDRLAKGGISALPQDLAEKQPSERDMSEPVVLVAAVRYGKHLPEALRFAKLFSRLKNPPPLYLFSVNLTARKPEKRSPEQSAYLRKLIRKFHLKPVLARAIAGKLDYPRYTAFDRHMIRFIMMLTGGPTDPHTVAEFTDWDEVDQLADLIVTYTAHS
jgi:Flavodoxin